MTEQHQDAATTASNTTTFPSAPPPPLPWQQGAASTAPLMQGITEFELAPVSAQEEGVPLSPSSQSVRLSRYTG